MGNQQVSGEKRITKVIGHRGWPTRHPDNTLAGIAAAAVVADLVEIDIRRSADGELVLSHDPVLGGLVICETPWPVLAELDLGGGAGPTTLNEVLAIAGSFSLNLEVKNVPFEPGYERDWGIAKEVAAKARAGDLLSSFDWPTADQMHTTRIELESGLLVERGGSVADAVEHALRMGHRYVIPHVLQATPAAIAAALATGLEVIVWTVNQPDQMRAFSEMGVAGIVTDDPGLAGEVLRPT